MEYSTIIFSDDDLIAFLEEMSKQLYAKVTKWSIRATEYYRNGFANSARICDIQADRYADQLFATRQFLSTNSI